MVVLVVWLSGAGEEKRRRSVRHFWWRLWLGATYVAAPFFFTDIINNIDMGKQYCKKISGLKTYKSVQQRTDEGVAYLIRLCGYNGDVASVVKNKEMMNKLFLLMSKMKARAITSFNCPLRS